jgi:hypothetical protein
MRRDDIKIGQTVRTLTTWRDVPPGTLGKIETVTGRCDATKVFTVRWYKKLIERESL